MVEHSPKILTSKEKPPPPLILTRLLYCFEAYMQVMVVHVLTDEWTFLSPNKQEQLTLKQFAFKMETLKRVSSPDVHKLSYFNTCQSKKKFFKATTNYPHPKPDIF